MKDDGQLYKGKHGQNNQEYMDGRSPAGQIASGTSRNGPKNHVSRWRFRDEMPVQPGEKPSPLKGALPAELEYAQYEHNSNKQENGKIKEHRKVGGPKGLPGSVPG